MGGRRFLGFGAVALAVALVAGCNGGSDDPTTSAPVSVEPTVDATTTDAVTGEPTDEPTPDPSPTDPWANGPPAVTLDMQYDTEEGAIAFVEFFMELSAYAYNHLDTAELSKYADINCVACNDTISSVATLLEGDFKVIGGVPTIEVIRSSTYYPDDAAYIVELEQAYTTTEVFGPDGSSVQTVDASRGATGFVVEYNGPYDWTMISFGKID